jgi:SRSO17 transposase
MPAKQGYTLLDRRLYLPQEWVEDDEYEKRRRRCGVPTDICFKTKLTLACDMVETIVASGMSGLSMADL